MVLMIEAILSEFYDETPTTRRVLERVPQDKLACGNASKEGTLGDLGMHVANVSGVVERIVKADEFSLPNAPSAALKSGRRHSDGSG